MVAHTTRTNEQPPLFHVPVSFRSGSKRKHNARWTHAWPERGAWGPFSVSDRALTKHSVWFMFGVCGKKKKKRPRLTSRTMSDADADARLFFDRPENVRRRSGAAGWAFVAAFPLLLWSPPPLSCCLEKVPLRERRKPRPGMVVAEHLLPAAQPAIKPL